MIIAITGKPRTFKTHLARALSKIPGSKYLDLSRDPVSVEDFTADNQILILDEVQRLNEIPEDCISIYRNLGRDLFLISQDSSYLARDLRSSIQIEINMTNHNLENLH
jgi:hypothetical protein